MNDYSRLEHLKLIQAIIARMAQNSFLLKGWSATLAAGLIATGVGRSSRAYALLALYPAIVLWGLDAYYLRQERLFRALHEAVAATSNNAPNSYSMNTNPLTPAVDSWGRTLFAQTVCLLHGTIVFVILLVLATSLLR
jgi:hypothetical protein